MGPVHASILSPYLETKIQGPNFLQPPPDLIEEEEYETEVIITHRTWGKGHRYLGKWTGYLSSENSWQLSNDLKGAPEILEEYNL